MPPQLIVDLFPDTLVETEIANIETEITNIELQPVAEEPQNTPASIAPPADIIPPVGIDPPAKEQPIIEQPVLEQPVMLEQKPFDFQGKNRKQILILTDNEKAQYLPEQELKFLVSVLKACGLTTEDVAILNISNQAAEFAALQSFFQNKAALLFGIEPERIGLPMNFPQFQLQNFSKCTYLHTPTLHEIEKDKGLKMRLWTCLKNLFAL